MAIYTEQRIKLNLNLTNSNNLVKIEVNCYNGTVASVNPGQRNQSPIHCGETRTLGKASDLKGKTVRFNCAANNPDEDEIKIEHIIFEEDENSIEYTFPNDYTGTPNFNKNDEHLNYKFYVNFI